MINFSDSLFLQYMSMAWLRLGKDHCCGKWNPIVRDRQLKRLVKVRERLWIKACVIAGLWQVIFTAVNHMAWSFNVLSCSTHCFIVVQQVRMSLPTTTIHPAPETKMFTLISPLLPEQWEKTNSLLHRLSSQHFVPSSCQCGCLLVLMLISVNWRGSINKWLGEGKRWLRKTVKGCHGVGFDMTRSILHLQLVSRSSFTFCLSLAWYLFFLIWHVGSRFCSETVIHSDVTSESNTFFISSLCIFVLVWVSIKGGRDMVQNDNEANTLRLCAPLPDSHVNV